jgi:HEAT repeat protein
VPRRFLPLTALIITLVALLVLHAVAGNVNDAKKKLKAALDSGDDDAAVEAVKELGNCNNAAAVKQLLVLALTTENLKILEAARESLSACTEEEAVEQLLKAVESKDWRMRALAAGACGGIDSSRARDAIVGLMSDKKPEVVREAIAAAVRQNKTATFVEPLIKLLERVIKEQGLTWVAVRKALIALTGEDYEKPSDWKKAWATIKEEVESERNKK